MSNEEVSKLWSALQARYRPTIALRVTTVLIESDLPGSRALPARAAHLGATSASRPTIVGVRARDGRLTPIIGGTSLVVTGTSLAAPDMVLRVGAVLRRLASPAVAASGRLAAGPIALDQSAHRVHVNGDEIELTATEFKLLHTLLEREGRVQTRTQLLQTVWQAQPDIQTRTVDMHMQRLRTKLGKAGDWIETVRGVGYRLRHPPPTRPRRRRS